jgi:hypothetical protein
MATAMNVSLRITTKVATSRRLMTSRLRPAVSAATGATTMLVDGLLAFAELLDGIAGLLNGDTKHIYGCLLNRCLAIIIH